jgi:hypothetical protein
MNGRPSRIPPLREPLEFVRNSRTGRVHILEWTPGPYDEDYEPVSVTMAQALSGLVVARERMLCGIAIRLLPGGTRRTGEKIGGEFADEDLCIPCVHALGDQQWRAFHVASRGEI